MPKINQEALKQSGRSPPSTRTSQIVAKVDELMALSDELEARITHTSNTRRQLLEATLIEAITS